MKWFVSVVLVGLVYLIAPSSYAKCPLETLGEAALSKMHLWKSTKSVEAQNALRAYAAQAKKDPKQEHQRRGEFLEAVLALLLGENSEEDPVTTLLTEYPQSLLADEGQWADLVYFLVLAQYFQDIDTDAEELRTEKSLQDQLMERFFEAIAKQEAKHAHLFLFGLHPSLIGELSGWLSKQVGIFVSRHLSDDDTVQEIESRLVFILGNFHFGVFGENARPGFLRKQTEYVNQDFFKIANYLAEILANPNGKKSNANQISTLLEAGAPEKDLYTKLAKYLHQTMSQKVSAEVGELPPTVKNLLLELFTSQNTWE